VLASVPRLKLHLGLTTTAQDDRLAQLVPEIDDAVKRYLGRNVEAEDRTDYYDGNGQRDLILRHPPISAITNVWVDATGSYGDGPNAFASTTLQVAGQDYVLVRDDGTRSLSGLLRAVGFGFNGALTAYPSNIAAKWRRRVWPVGEGNVKVEQRSGWEEGDVPRDILLACDQFGAFVYRTATYGGLYIGSSVHLGEFSKSLLATRGQYPEIGSVQQLLAQYVDRGF
jgi:hypothetical protein